MKMITHEAPCTDRYQGFTLIYNKYLIELLVLIINQVIKSKWSFYV